jgi:cold shock CspA family protein
MTATYEGQCKFFDSVKGFGFIRVISDERKNQEVYVHVSNLNPANPSRIKVLKAGEYCSFTLEQSDASRLKACDVKGIDSGPLLCESNPNSRSLYSTTPQPTVKKEKEKEKESDENTWTSVVKGKNKKVDETEKKTDEGKEKEEEKQVVKENNQFWGVVKWFNNKLAYGFMTLKGGPKEDLVNTNMFVHYTSVEPEYSTYRTLVSGEYVSFNIKEHDKGYQAINVKGYKDGSIICDHNVMNMNSKVDKPVSKNDTVSISTENFLKILSKIK